MSDTGKQQFTANQSIYQLSEKDRSVPDDIDMWGSVLTRLFLTLRSHKSIPSDLEVIKLEYILKLKAQWLTASRNVSASIQSLRFIWVWEWTQVL